MANGTSAEGCSQGPREQRGGGAPAPEQVPDSAGSARMVVWAGPGLGAWPNRGVVWCGCGRGPVRKGWIRCRQGLSGKGTAVWVWSGRNRAPRGEGSSGGRSLQNPARTAQEGVVRGWAELKVGKPSLTSSSGSTVGFLPRLRTGTGTQRSPSSGLRGLSSGLCT